MSLRTTVYLSNVSNLSDARYGAGMGVSYLGFPMDGNNALSPEQFLEIVSWVSGPENILEFTNSTIDQIKEVVEKCDCKNICVNDRALAEGLIQEGYTVYLDNRESEDLPDLDIEAAFIHNFTIAEHNLYPYPLLLAKDMGVEDLANIVGHPNISGITLFGTDEIRPGYKDYDQIADILEALETE